jgi:hypothetical protein
MFIVLTQHKHRMREVPAYLYEGQSVVGEPVENFFGTYGLIVDTGSDDLYRANYLRDRFASGMFGAVVFETLTDANKYIEDSKVL